MTLHKLKFLLKLSFRDLNAFDGFLLGFIISLGITSLKIYGDDPFSIFNSYVAAISAILGVFCVVLGAKGSIANWLFGMVEGVMHIYICFCTHMYGDFLQRLFYNLPMQFIGYKKWNKRIRHKNTTAIRTQYMNWNQRFITMAVVAVATYALGVFLQHFGPWLIGVITSFLPDMHFKTLKLDYDNPIQLWLDSFTTVMSIVTLWISTRAYVEQWIMWLIINVAYITMWNMSDSVFSTMTVAKYSIYLVNSLYGIYMWHKLSKSDA